MERAELVFIPFPGIGHLVSTIETAKILVEQNQNLSITLVIFKFPLETKIESYIKSLSESPISRMKLVEIVQEQDSNSLPSKGESKSTFLFDWIDSHKSKVRNVVPRISKLSGIMVDMFCTCMIDVANEFGVPSYIFYPSGAAMLGLTLHLQTLRDDFKHDITDYKDKDVKLDIPTYINPVPTKVFPGVLFDKEGGCEGFLDQAKRYRETKGIIINTFVELETHAIQALSKDSTIPPIYTAGQILNVQIKQKSEPHDNLIQWLDLQPDSSVVFLCFGSFGSFSNEQVKEIANAIERSRQRFLWSLRRPPGEGKIESPGEYDNFEHVLPEGFLNRTSEIGKVMGWAPQVTVLSHPAVGGFVSHYGWNSTLESIWYGVPMATWPLYAEQQVNAFKMVKELEMAVEVKMDYRKDFPYAEGVSSEILGADLIQQSIKSLMDPQNEIRKKVMEMKEKSRMALKEGGSSYSSLQCFVRNLLATDP